MEHELWLTAFLNQLLGKPIGALLTSLGMHLESPDHPITNYFAMEILVVVFIMALLALVRSQLSADRPGKIQQVLEMIIEGLEQQGEEVIGHGAKQFVPLLFTLALFIFLSNVMGEIPHLETPTAVIEVTLGCALVAFVYYNFWGLRHHGVFGYMKHFMGPVMLIAPLMFIIELISHLARAMSLSVRLYANMLAGEQITEVFRQLPQLADNVLFSSFLAVLPSLFMALHVAVAALQTFIFILLTMVYLSGAVADEH